MKPVMPEPLRLNSEQEDNSGIAQVLQRLSAIEDRLHLLETRGRRLGPGPLSPAEIGRDRDRIVAALQARHPDGEFKPAPPPVDMSARVLADGSPVTEDHREINPATGQQKAYVVLSDEERAKGFVRSVRRTYVHEKCGVATTMSQSIAETYARSPEFYSGTFCVGCRAHFPVGHDGEFVWDDGSKVGA